MLQKHQVICLLLFSVLSSLLVSGDFTHILESLAIHLKGGLSYFIWDFKVILVKECSSIHILLSFKPVGLLVTPVVNQWYCSLFSWWRQDYRGVRGVMPTLDEALLQSTIASLMSELGNSWFISEASWNDFLKDIKAVLKILIP